MKTLKINEICKKGSSSLKQKDVEGCSGIYPVFGAGGVIGHIDSYHQEKEYIAIVKDGSGIGRVTFMPAKSSVIGTLQYILPKEGFNIKYVEYCLQSLDLSKYKQGAAIPHIYFRDYGEMIVKVTPNESEQQEIVDYLDASFAKIDALKKNAEESLANAKALFQASLKELLEPKEGWEKKTLKEIGKTQTGTTPSKSNPLFYGNDVPFIRPSEIDIDGNGNIEYNSELKLSTEGAEKGRIFGAGSVLMVCIGATIGKTGFCVRNVSANQQINVLTPNTEYNSKYLYYAMINPKFHNLVIKEGASAQATLPIINKGKWEQLPLWIPPFPTQQSLVSHLDALSEKVSQLQANYEKTIKECDALKQALLRDIFE